MMIPERHFIDGGRRGITIEELRPRIHAKNRNPIIEVRGELDLIIELDKIETLDVSYERQIAESPISEELTTPTSTDIIATTNPIEVNLSGHLGTKWKDGEMVSNRDTELNALYELHRRKKIIKFESDPIILDACIITELSVDEIVSKNMYQFDMTLTEIDVYSPITIEALYEDEEYHDVPSDQDFETVVLTEPESAEAEEDESFWSWWPFW